MPSLARPAARAGAAVLALTGLLAAPAGAAGPPPLPAPKPEPPARIEAPAAPRDSAATDATQTFRRLAPLPGRKPTPSRRALHTVLSHRDAERYRRIFALQSVADWARADGLIATLDDDILLGHVLAQRYLHPTGWRSSFAELEAWLVRFRDHPQAVRIHALALKRRPAGAARPSAPGNAAFERFPERGWPAPAPNGGHGGAAPGLDTPQGGELDDLIRTIRRDLRAGRYERAASRLAGTGFRELADTDTEDRMTAEVAHGFLAAGDDRRALALTVPAIERSGARAVLAGWVAGLAAYRLGDLDGARRAFETAAGSPQALARAAAYWAARLNLLTGRPQHVARYLDRAAAGDGFYGLLARHALGRTLAPTTGLPEPARGDRLALATLPAVRRALALVQAGQHHRADFELGPVSADERPALASAALHLAVEIGLPATQLRLADEFLRGWGERFDEALYPLPPWAPEDGFRIDPALLWAIMRQESSFVTFARSGAGARGPMQIMPSTAAFISGDPRFRDTTRHLLDDPGISLALAQDYIRHLLDSPRVRGNLFYMLAAYNGGPGNLRRWLAAGSATDDPLLFIETIPARETRFFIERVMENYWLYGMRLGRGPRTLDTTARGAWPLYPEEEANRAGNRP